MKPRTKLILQGFLYFALGILFLNRPLLKTHLIVIIIGSVLIGFGVAIFLEGLFRTKGVKAKVFQVLEGLLIGTFGYMFFLTRPLVGGAILVYLVIWWTVLMAIYSTALLKEVESGWKWIGIVLNVVVIGIGIYSIFNPILAAKVFYWVVGFQLLFTGANRLILGITNKSLPEKEKKAE